MSTIRILLVDDHPMVRRGLRSLLTAYPGIEVVGEAVDGAQALQAAAELRPDVILLDIRLPGPDGVEVAYQLRHSAPEAKIVILTAYDQAEYVSRALRAGVHAYLLKRSSDESLVDAVRSVHRGKRLLSPSLVDQVLREFQYVARAQARCETDLSEKELEVLDLIASGATTAQIAAELYWSERTVKRKIRDIREKLGASTRAEAVAQAIKHGLI